MSDNIPSGNTESCSEVSSSYSMLKSASRFVDFTPKRSNITKNAKSRPTENIKKGLSGNVKELSSWQPVPKKHVSPDRSFTDFYCKVCDSHMNSSQMWESHVKGKRHLKNMVSPASSSSKQKTVSSSKEPLIENELHKIVDPIVGLKYICEIRKLESKLGASYKCFLCKSNLANEHLLINHLYGLKHKMAYIKETDPDVYKLMESFGLKTRALENLANEHTMKLEEKHGRGTVQVEINETTPKKHNFSMDYKDPKRKHIFMDYENSSLKRHLSEDYENPRKIGHLSMDCENSLKKHLSLDYKDSSKKHYLSMDPDEPPMKRRFSIDYKHLSKKQTTDSIYSSSWLDIHRSVPYQTHSLSHQSFDRGKSPLRIDVNCAQGISDDAKRDLYVRKLAHEARLNTIGSLPSGINSHLNSPSIVNLTDSRQRVMLSQTTPHHRSLINEELIIKNNHTVMDFLSIIPTLPIAKRLEVFEKMIPAEPSTHLECVRLKEISNSLKLSVMKYEAMNLSPEQQKLLKELQINTNSIASLNNNMISSSNTNNIPSANTNNIPSLMTAPSVQGTNYCLYRTDYEPKLLPNNLGRNRTTPETIPLRVPTIDGDKLQNNFLVSDALTELWNKIIHSTNTRNLYFS